MKKIRIVTIVFAIFLNSTSHASVNFSDWHSKILSLPENPDSFQKCPLTFEEFLDTANTYKAISRNELSQGSWVEAKPTPKWLDYDRPEFIPFVQKLNIPSKSDVAFFGDLHGSIHSLIRTLKRMQTEGIINDSFEIIKPNFYFMFLGDFVDRGMYGVEVLYTIMQLKIHNPKQVFFARGNHEDVYINMGHGFQDELESKFDRQNFMPIYRIYDFMPPAIFLGCNNNYIQCCHGGVEMGYNPQRLLDSNSEFELIESFDRKDVVKSLPGKIKREIRNNIPLKEITNFTANAPSTLIDNLCINLGFMWNDFIPSDTDKIVRYKHGRGWVYGKTLTSLILSMYGANNKVRAIFRAHQHHGEMLDMLIENNGIVNLWDGMVYTFLSAPLRNLRFNKDAFGLLKVEDKFENWTLENKGREITP